MLDRSHKAGPVISHCLGQFHQLRRQVLGAGDRDADSSGVSWMAAGDFPRIDRACGGFFHPPDERVAGDGGGVADSMPGKPAISCRARRSPTPRACSTA